MIFLVYFLIKRSTIFANSYLISKNHYDSIDLEEERLLTTQQLPVKGMIDIYQTVL